MMEVGLIAPLLMLLVMCTVGLGWMLRDQVGLETAARSAARYASENPAATSGSDPAPANTIEGVLQADANSSVGVVAIHNVDQPGTLTPGASWIAVRYFDNSTTPPTECGDYLVSGGYRTLGAYTHATCVRAGNLVEVDVGYVYSAPPRIPNQYPIVVKDAEIMLT